MAGRAVEGACLCGVVRFQVRMPSLFCGHCHCTMCQRHHAAGYVTWFAVTRRQLEITAGRSELREYRSSELGKRSFCGVCGSSLFCEIGAHPNQIDIPLASMQGPIDREPEAHFFFDDHAAWVVVSDDLPRLGGATGMEPLDPAP